LQRLEHVKIVNVRDCIRALDIPVFVKNCVKVSGLESDLIEEKTYEIIALLLSKTDLGDFANMKAFWSYLRISVIRQAYKCSKGKEKNVDLSGQEPTEDKTPEGQLFGALEKQSLKKVVDEVLKKHQAPRGKIKEIRQLLTVLLEQEEFIHIQKSGENKGAWVFNAAGLGRALKWDRAKVCYRLKQLRQIFSKEVRLQGLELSDPE